MFLVNFVRKFLGVFVKYWMFEVVGISYLVKLWIFQFEQQLLEIFGLSYFLGLFWFVVFLKFRRIFSVLNKLYLFKIMLFDLVSLWRYYILLYSLFKRFVQLFVVVFVGILYKLVLSLLMLQKLVIIFSLFCYFNILIK